MEIAIYIVLLVLFLGFSAFFSSAETAFIGASRVRIRHLENGRETKAARVVQMMRYPERFLSSVLLGNNLANTAIATLGTLIAVSYMSDNTGAIVATVCVTIVLLIFGEVTPKTIATHHAERIALFYVRPLEVISRVFHPFVVVLSWLASKVTRMVGAPSVRRLLLTEQEIRTAISVWQEEGVVEKDEAVMLHKVFDFGDRPIHEVMIPRTEVVWIEQGTKLADFLNVYAQNPHSRFPVYEGNSDNVTGMIFIKDVLLAQVQDSLDRESPVNELIRPVYFVPEAKRISEVFTEMQAEGYQLAIVIDEYGGTAGVVTLNQLVGEIVGELGDELVKPEREFETIDATTFQIDGSVRIEEINEQLDLELPLGDYETVAGFMLSLLGHIPQEGEQIRYDKLKLVVTVMRGKKIEKILVTKEF